MKKYITILLVIVTPSWVMAQNLDFDSFFRKYSGQDEYTTIELSGTLLNMLAGDSAGDAFTGINNFKLITADQPDAQFRRDANSITADAGFERLININSNDKGFVLYHKKGKNGAHSQFLMVAIGDDNVTILYLDGDIDMKNVSRLSSLSGMFAGE